MPRRSLGGASAASPAASPAAAAPTTATAAPRGGDEADAATPRRGGGGRGGGGGAGAGGGGGGGGVSVGVGVGGAAPAPASAPATASRPAGGASATTTTPASAKAKAKGTRPPSTGRGGGGGAATPSRDGTLRASLAEHAKTSTEHAVQSRVLVNAAEMQARGLASGDAAVVELAPQPRDAEGDAEGGAEGGVPAASSAALVVTAWTLGSVPAGGALLSPEAAAFFAARFAPGAAPASVAVLLRAAPGARRAASVTLSYAPASPVAPQRCPLLPPDGDQLPASTERYLAYTLLHAALGAGTRVAVYSGGSSLTLTVRDVGFGGGGGGGGAPAAPALVGVVDMATTFSVVPEAGAPPRGKDAAGPVPAPAAELEPLQGADAALDKLCELVAANLAGETRGQLLRMGLDPVCGALIFGPSGSGKTLLARHVARRLDLPLVELQGATMTPREMERAFAAGGVLDEGPRNPKAPTTPTLILLDDVDVGCPSRSESGSASDVWAGGSVETVSSLLVLMDRARKAPLFVLGTAKSPDSLDGALRRPGRLEVEVELAPPDARARAAMLSAHLARYPHAVAPEAVKRVADRMHGFVGADVAMLARDAAWRALDRGSAALEEADVEAAFLAASPSALREVAVEVPRVRWSDVGGMEGVKALLRQCVELPLKRPDAFQRLGIQPPAGVLLYGPPGCSKTLMAKCVATESDMNFVAVKGPELLSKWVGDSEKAVQATFRRARAAAPCVVFFDEIDALAGSREDASEGGAGGVSARVLSQLLQEMDGVQERGRVVVLCATNRPDMLDEALLRPGRLDRLVYVPPPDAPARAQILRIHLRGVPVAEDVDEGFFQELARDQLQGFSGAEVAAVCRDACLEAVDKGEPHVTRPALERAAAQVKPQITRDMLAFYERFERRSR